jgi:diadenosine tetraphosphate (Ap4A) HIT family hydrolase
MSGYFYETEHWKLVLVTDQRYLGRLVIKTKVPREHLPDLTVEEQLDFFVLIKKLESFFVDKIGTTMFNYSCLMNFAYRDNETPHVHYHFRPRYKNPVMIIGKEFSDPNFGQPHLEPSQNNNGEVTIPDDVRKYIEDELVAYLK